MNPARFDTISRFFAERRLSRRQAIAGGVALAATGPAIAVAQDATPVASPESGDDASGPEMLFVQSFESGEVVPGTGTAGRYTVTLEHGLGQTIYFSDRPDRIVGAAPTAEFLEGLGFTPDNPPNAAILTESGDGETSFAVVELFDPAYDTESATLTYEMAVLEHWQDATDLGFTETPVDLGALGATFGTAHLFIDGCSNMDMICFNLDGTRNTVGVIPEADYGGVCFSSDSNACLPCKPWIPDYQDANVFWSEQCTVRYADKCGAGGCGWTFLP